MARITIPFGVGVREDVDPRVMPDGALKRVENLRLEREGRLVLRRGYTARALSTPTVSAVSTFTPTDLCSYNGRLLALGCSSALSTKSPRDVYELVNSSLFQWRPTDGEHEPRLCPVTGVRDVGRVPAQVDSIAVYDVGAGGGLVCMAWQTVTVAQTVVHIFNPDTDTTVLLGAVSGMSRPRVVAVGSVFFVMGIVGTTYALYRFDKATDNALTPLTDVFAAGGAISISDATVSEDGSGFIVGIARNATPAVTLALCSSAGAVTSTITGPAVSLARMAVFRQSARVHLVACESGDGHADLYTYTAAGALENTTLDLASGAVIARQPGLCITGTQSDLCILLNNNANDLLYMVRVDPSTHGSFSDRSWHRVHSATKPAQTPQSEAFGGTFIDSTSTLANFIGIVGRAQSTATEMVAVATDPALAAEPNSLHAPHLAKDVSTGKYYWPKFVRDGDGRSNPVVSELLIDDSGRRQVAVVDNSLYLSGGAPQIFAGRQVVEAGFLNRPVIVSATPSNGAGSLTNGALYVVCATYEWYDEQGRFHTSEPSDITEVTMGGSDDTLTVVVTGPLSARCNATNQAYGGAVKIVVWRSLAAPDKQLLRDSTATVSPGTFGATSTFVLTQADISLEDEAILYTQGASGARSGPNAFTPPRPCRYLYASGDRLTLGGLPQDAQIQESRAAFPSEPITWAANLGGLASAPERVLAVLRLDERRLTLTARGIFEYTGEGLDINGVGDLGSPRRLPSPGGLHGGADGWRSIVETAIGIFFQLSADSIFLIPRGGGAPVFIGAPVQTTLSSYPVITSATYLKTEQLVCFTCNDSGATDSVILVYDLSAQQWFVDTESSALLASCEYQGRLVLLRANNTIEFQDTALPPASFITPVIETGTIYPFSKGGQGQIDEIQLYAEFLGACNVICSLSYDDGANYTALATKAVSSASLLPIKWGPQAMRGDRVRLRFTTTDLSGSTAQLAWQFCTIDFTAHNRSALRNANQKG